MPAAHPRWVSRICPTFMRLGTPSGFNTMSTGAPAGRNGMSSSGTMRSTMPLLPWRPAILSPTEIFRFSARYTFTSWITPGGSSSGWRVLSIWVSAFSSLLARREILLHGAVLQHQGHFLPVEQLRHFLEQHRGDAGLLFVLQPAHFADPLAAI